ncbi:MAG: DNA repair protein RadA [Sphingobacteriaceae bacterium]|nr:DNA repair protein RadA [Sphingobacteriaceae bacterium]
MARAMTMKNMLDIKHELFVFDGIWAETIGQPTKNGFWIIYGPEKNFKTAFALMMANYLRQHERTIYVSAEEGSDVDFVKACQRMGLDEKSKNILFTEYEPLEELTTRLNKQKAPRIVFIDNATVYKDELERGGLMKLKKDNPNVLFILIAHEERNLPYTAPAVLCRKLAKRIFHVKGAAVEVSGRCPGGTIVVNEEKAALYHGSRV